jgi:hypothetical protein
MALHIKTSSALHTPTSASYIYIPHEALGRDVILPLHNRTRTARIPSVSLFMVSKRAARLCVLSEPVPTLLMAPKRRRDNRNDDEGQPKITWVSDELYRGVFILSRCHSLARSVLQLDLNDKRHSGRLQLNARLAIYQLPSRQVRSIPRPRGEAGRKSTTNNDGERRDGFTLKDLLKRESNVNAEHYTMIQVCCTFSLLPMFIRCRTPCTVWPRGTWTSVVRGGRIRENSWLPCASKCVRLSSNGSNSERRPGSEIAPLSLRLRRILARARASEATPRLYKG